MVEWAVNLALMSSWPQQSQRHDDEAGSSQPVLPKKHKPKKKESNQFKNNSIINSATVFRDFELAIVRINVCTKKGKFVYELIYLQYGPGLHSPAICKLSK
jgi:hypothetical protein